MEKFSGPSPWARGICVGVFGFCIPRFASAGLLAILMAFAPVAQAQAVYIKNDFLTGNDFQRLPPTSKRGFAMGFVAGAFVAPMFGAQKQDIRWIENCINGMDDVQLVAVIDKWLAGNPVRWHEPMGVLTYAALRESCPK